MTAIQEAYEWFEDRYSSPSGLSTAEVEMRDIISLTLLINVDELDYDGIMLVFGCLDRLYIPNPDYIYRHLFEGIKEYYVEQYPEEYLIWKLSN